MSDKILRVSNIDAMVNTIKTHVENEINETIEGLQSQIADKSIDASKKIVDGSITKELLDDNIKLEFTEVGSQLDSVKANVKELSSQIDEIMNEITTVEYGQLTTDDVTTEYQSCVSDSSIIAPSEVNGNYEWVTFVPEVKALKFRLVHGETFVNLMAHNSDAKVLTICLKSQLYGVIRCFYNSGRIDISRFELPKTSLGNIISFEFVSNGIYLFKIYNDDGMVTDEMELDLTSYSDISSYTNNFGFLYYYSTKGVKLASDVTVINEGRPNLDSLSTKIYNIKSDISVVKKDISSIKDIIANGGGGENSKIIDLIMFMGQSNMAGRGVASESPIVPSGQGYEFRAISDATKLYPIVEPFGVNENNNSSGVSESTKTGSMVSSFVINYFKATQTPVVAVSCSKGGSSISYWQPDGNPLNDAINRHNIAKEWLLNNGYIIRHDFMVWCQGETDGDNSTTGDDYKSKLNIMVEEMMKHGIEKCFLVRIGELNSSTTPNKYDEIISAQTEICKENDNFVLVGTKFAGMRARSLMKDSFHYKQQGYNEQGEEAGKNTAFFINNMKEPIIYDVKYDNLYYSKK